MNNKNNLIADEIRVLDDSFSSKTFILLYYNIIDIIL